MKTQTGFNYLLSLELKTGSLEDTVCVCERERERHRGRQAHGEKRVQERKKTIMGPELEWLTKAI